MTAQLATSFPGIALFAVDIELAPLRVAGANHPTAVYVQASLARLLALPDWTEVNPGHYAGSVCGRGMDGAADVNDHFTRAS